ncbi:MAG: hypothetical protein AAGD32_00730 [Planctomycetota bacterium]
MLLLLALLGCEASLPVTEESVEGTWTASYDHVPLTLVLNADKTFEFDTGNPTGKPGAAWAFSEWGALPSFGTWRLTSGDEPELVWMIDGGLADSAFVRNVGDTSLTLQFDGKPNVVFTKK